MVKLFVNGQSYCEKKDGKWFITDADYEVYKEAVASEIVLKLLEFNWLPVGYFEVLQQAMTDAGLNNRLIMSPMNVAEYCHDYILCDNSEVDELEKLAIFRELRETLEKDGR